MKVMYFLIPFLSVSCGFSKSKKHSEAPKSDAPKTNSSNGGDHDNKNPSSSTPGKNESSGPAQNVSVKPQSIPEKVDIGFAVCDATGNQNILVECVIKPNELAGKQQVISVFKVTYRYSCPLGGNDLMLKISDTNQTILTNTGRDVTTLNTATLVGFGPLTLQGTNNGDDLKATWVARDCNLTIQKVEVTPASAM